MKNNIFSASVGIIGGADGPTAIFLTRPLLPPFLIAALVLAAAFSVIGIVWYRRKKKKN